MNPTIPSPTEEVRLKHYETVVVDATDPFDDGTHCLNCGAALEGTYCSACGQKRVRRLTLKGVIRDAFRAFATVDSKVMRTVIGMTLRPGQVVRAYVDGKRWAYLNPVKYLLFTTTLFLLVIKAFGVEVWRLTNAAPENFMLIFSLLSYLMIVNVLGPAGVQRLVFRKRRKNFAECYVFGLFCYGHLALFFGIAALLGAYDSFANYSVILGGMVLFLAWALVGFYRTRIWWALPTAFGMVVAYYFVGVLVSMLMRFVFYSFGILTPGS